HAHHRVVAPAGEATAGLRARAVDDGAFALAHGAGGVGHQATGVVDLGVERAGGDAEAQRHVALLVLGDGGHPAIVAVGRVRALLEDAEVVAPVDAQLVPADAGRAAGGDRVAD